MFDSTLDYPDFTSSYKNINTVLYSKDEDSSKFFQ